MANLLNLKTSLLTMYVHGKNNKLDNGMHLFHDMKYIY